MTERISLHGLQVATSLRDFIESEALPGSGVQADAFWRGLASIIHDLAPLNRALLAKRDEFAAALDAWYGQHPGRIADMAGYRAWLQSIGYLVDAPEHVAVTTAHVDPEIAEQAGPQLVVPATIARYALNAANARWGSLYDALYGTDAIADDDGAARGKSYNPVRGKRVIACGRCFLDAAIPLAAGSHADASAYAVVDGALRVTMADGGVTGLADPAAWRGYRGEPSAPDALLFVHHGLHLAIAFDATDPVGRDDAAHV